MSSSRSRTAFALGKSLALSLSIAALAGCASTPQPLYDWENYIGATYLYLKGGDQDPLRGIEQLEAQLQKSEASGRLPPPGLHGHLALLHSKAGNEQAAIAHLHRERARFPESAAYTEFLIANFKRKDAQ